MVSLSIGRRAPLVGPHRLASPGVRFAHRAYERRHPGVILHALRASTSMPLETSTANGRNWRIASPTFCALKPPLKTARCAVCGNKRPIEDLAATTVIRHQGVEQEAARFRIMKPRFYQIGRLRRGPRAPRAATAGVPRGRASHCSGVSSPWNCSSVSGTSRTTASISASVAFTNSPTTDTNGGARRASSAACAIDTARGSSGRTRGRSHRHRARPRAARRRASTARTA